MARLVLLFLVAVMMTARSTDPLSQIWGCWAIKKALPTTNISALTDAQVKKLIHRRIVYSPECARSGKTILRPPGYSVESLSEVQFFEGNHIPLTQLGITEPRVTVIDLTSADTSAEPFVGATLFVGSGKVIILYEGVYFELQKVKESKNCSCAK